MNKPTKLPASPPSVPTYGIMKQRLPLVEETGHKATDVARVLGIKKVSVHHAVKKGKKSSCAVKSDPAFI
jgi:hypothetical protein